MLKVTNNSQKSVYSISRRQKQQLSKKSTYQALLDSVTIGKDSTNFQIINEATKVR